MYDYTHTSQTFGNVTVYRCKSTETCFLKNVVEQAESCLSKSSGVRIGTWEGFDLSAVFYTMKRNAMEKKINVIYNYKLVKS